MARQAKQAEKAEQAKTAEAMLWEEATDAARDGVSPSAARIMRALPLGCGREPALGGRR